MGKDMMEHAIEYAKRGRAIIPLVPGKKKPHIKRPYKNATTNFEIIKKWWSKWPQADIGIVTGDQSGIFVVDIDPRNGGEATLRDLEETHGLFPETLKVSTGGGGFHLYYRLPEGQTYELKSKLGKGIDIQANKKLVVAPPSIHESGNEYEWENNREPAIAPDWLIDILKAKPKPNTFTPFDYDGFDVDDAQDLFRYIDPDLPYDDWRDVIFASLNIGVSEGFLANRSQKGEKWDDNKFNQVVNSFDPARCTFDIHKLQWLASRGLSEHAFHLSCKELPESPGDKLDSIRALCDAMSYGVFRTKPVHNYFAYYTGFGKTSICIAFVRALHDKRIDKGILIVLEKVEDLYKLKNSPLLSDVNINCYHSKKDSISIEEAKNTQFLLITHEQLGTRGNSYGLPYNGKKRALCIWDERITRNLAISINQQRLLGDIAKAQAELEYRNRNENLYEEAYEAAVQHFNKMLIAIKNATINEIFELPQKPSDTRFLYNKGTPFLNELLKVNNNKARLCNASNRPSVITFNERIDEDNLIILDAYADESFTVTHDPNARIRKSSFNIDYSDVRINLYNNAKSSRDALNNAKYLSKIINAAKEIIDKRLDEEFLILTSKNNTSSSIERTVRKELETYGNVKIETWGRHAGTNEYKDITNVIIIGLRHRDKNELAASILAAKGDIHADLSTYEINEAYSSHLAEDVYQCVFWRFRSSILVLFDHQIFPTR